MKKLPLQVVLSVDALTIPLTGIGRYTWELAARIPLCDSVQRVRFYWQERWIKNPFDLLDPAHHPLRKTWLQKQEPHWLREMRLKLQCRGRLFHGLNYFLPSCADIGIATIHDLSVFKYPETHPAKRVRQFEKHFLATLKRADHLITDTAAIRQEVIETFSWPADKITAVHLGVSDCFKPRLQEEIIEVLGRYGLAQGRYSLCVSTVEPRKKIDCLLSAYGCLSPALRARYPLMLSGSKGWKSEELHKRIESCCTEGWLRYQGFVPMADLPYLYAGANLFVYPSIYEGFGLPVLEAMASGVPVIASFDSALTEITGGAAILTDPDDVDLLTMLIERGLSDDDWRANARLRGLEVAKGYSWERCVYETLNLYKLCG